MTWFRKKDQKIEPVPADERVVKTEGIFVKCPECDAALYLYYKWYGQTYRVPTYGKILKIVRLAKARGIAVAIWRRCVAIFR